MELVTVSETPLPIRVAKGVGLVAAGLGLIGINTLPVLAAAWAPRLPAMLGLAAGARVLLAMPLTRGWRGVLLGSWLLQVLVWLGAPDDSLLDLALGGAALHWVVYLLQAPRAARVIQQSVGWLMLLMSLMMGAVLCLYTAAYTSSCWTICPELQPRASEIAGALVAIGVAPYLAVMLLRRRPEPRTLAIGFAVFTLASCPLGSAPSVVVYGLAAVIARAWECMDGGHAE
jgi:hypothetical protein